MKEWKCKDCTVFGTDACIYPSMKEEYKACNFVVVDADEAYQQGRADALDHCEKCETDQWDALYKAEMKGRADAFQEIAYSDSVIKEPFEELAYQKGRAEAIDEFAETLKSSAFIDIREYPTINEVADRLKEQKKC